MTAIGGEPRPDWQPGEIEPANGLQPGVEEVDPRARLHALAIQH